MLSITRRADEFARIGADILIRVRSGDLRFHIVADRVRFPVDRIQAGHPQFHLCQLAIRHVDRKSFKLTGGQDLLLIGTAIRIPITLKCKWARIDVLAPAMDQVALVKFRGSREQTELEADRVALRFPIATNYAGHGAA